MDARQFTTHQDHQLVTYDQACKLLVVSRTTLWRLVKTDSLFPRPILLGERSPRLLLTELQHYLKQKSVCVSSGSGGDNA